jgi:hypothetical protein
MQPGTGTGTGKKPRNWKDVQLIISSISLALTLGLWGMWSSREKHVAGVQDEGFIPSRPQAAVPPEPMLLPGQTLFLMTPAPETTATVSNQEQPRRRNKDKGGGGGGNADAGTGSS